MDVLYANCAGLDIHKDTVVACSRRMIDGKVTREVRTFKTTTSAAPSQTRSNASPPKSKALAMT